MTRPPTYETGKIPANPEEQAKLMQQALREIEKIHEMILARRGGEPFSREYIEQLLDQVRGRIDADID